MLDIIILTIFFACGYLVVYHHVIYPLILKLLSKYTNDSEPKIVSRRYISSDHDDNLSRFSIVIPAFNEEKYIVDKIHNLSFLDYPNDKYELILLCDGCSDRTYDLASKTLAQTSCQDIKFKVFNFEENRGKVAVLKEGISKASFENIVLSDVSALLPINALLMLHTHFQSADIGAVSGGYQFAEKGTPGEQKYWQYQRELKKRESNIASVLGAHGAFYAIRKTCYEEIPEDTINDDFLIPMNVIKLGYRVVYEHRVAAIELENVKLNQDMKRRVRIAAGNLQQLRLLLPLLSPKYGWNAINFASGKALRAITPFLLFLIFCSSTYLSFVHWAFLAITLLQCCVYGGVYLLEKFNKQLNNRVVNLVCYLVKGYWVGLVGSTRYLLGKQKKVWSKI